MADAAATEETRLGGQRLLVVGPSWVGDMVMAQSLFKTLKRAGAARVAVVAPAWSRPILERMSEVDEVVELVVGHGEFGFAARRRLARGLRGRFDRAIVLPRSWKSALVPLLAWVPRRVGFTGEQRYGLLNQRRKLDKSVLDQTVKRFVALGLPEAATERGDFALPRPELRLDPDNLARLLDQHGLGVRPAIGMMPGAEYGPAKQWPLAYFHELAARLIEQGFEVRVLGGPKDRAAGDEIVAGLEHAHNLCGETRLGDAVDLLGDCAQVVTNDSGLMHVAAAVGTRIQAIYGSSSPAYTPPLTDNAEIHYLALSCSPCFERTCPLGHTNCLNHIAPERLLRSILATA
ncbi:lipopolysaccharide heptosyltransferase II [Halomonas sp. V046]|uniref:lipopolysaccharide heptosyltransferase II n=1 Tax=Halomonas sp. V046 TaxID=3459611 RepID=UPI004043E056